MADQAHKFDVDLDLNGNVLRKFKAETITVFPAANSNESRVVYKDGNYWYSNGIEWFALYTSGGDSILTIQGPLAYNGELTPPVITSSQDNYNPTGLSNCNFLRIEATGNVNISGLLAPLSTVGNQAIFICNVGNTGTVTILDSSALSLPANRFLIGGPKNLQSNEGIMVIYDQTSLRWRSQSVNI